MKKAIGIFCILGSVFFLVVAKVFAAAPEGTVSPANIEIKSTEEGGYLLYVDEKPFLIKGVGYKSALKGKDLELQLGFSHPVGVKAPAGIEFEVDPKKNTIVVRGIDKQLVGETAANIRKWRKPEPYKGKGIAYEGEYIPRKAGKSAAGGAA